VKTLGIDPGSFSYDICGLEDGEVFLSKSFLTREVVSDPELIASLVGEDLVCVVAPSGYGLPVKDISTLTEKDLLLVTLKSTEKSTLGIRKVLSFLSRRGARCFTVPGVKHLSTVPKWRKTNRIDMGTADKVCATAFALFQHREKTGQKYEESSFILAELGYAFNAFIAVKNGGIVDGIGGSCATIGFRSCGFLDAELAYLLGDIEKNLVISGGITDLLKNLEISIEDLIIKAEEGKKEYETALNAYLDGIIKDIYRLIPSVYPTTEEEPLIYLSGRYGQNKRLIKKLRENLLKAKIFPVEKLDPETKEAAQGAAIIANGLAGGANKPLIEVLKIKEAKGTILDNIYVTPTQRLKEWLKNTY